MSTPISADVDGTVGVEPRLDPDPVPAASDDDLGLTGDGSWGRYGRRPVILLALVGLIDGIDKGILPGVVTSIQDDLGFSDFQIGLLESAFVIASFAIALPAGYLADRRRRTRIISLTMASWAVISGLTATVRNYAQFFAVRAALGAGETIDDPASSSLLADYYPAHIRGRAYSYQRVTGTLGRAVGVVLAGIIGALFGWRAAFLLVGIPGSILAVAIWRLPEPARGDSDHINEVLVSDEVVRAESRGDAVRSLMADVRAAFAVPSLRALVIGTAVAQGGLSGFAFWAVVFHERHSGMSSEQAAGTAGLAIIIGAVAGTLAGGRVADRLRPRSLSAPMTAAGLSLAAGAGMLYLSFIGDIPVWTLKVPLQVVGVALVVGALPATSAMTSEVVRAGLRGTAFSLTRVLSSLIAAFSPPLIGWIADRHLIEVIPSEAAEVLLKGDIARAYMIVSPFLLVGAWMMFRGRVHVAEDIARAQEVGRE